MTTEQIVTPSPSRRAAMKDIAAFFKQRLTPRVGFAVAVWQIETRTATPLALLLVATLGRWEGALTMGVWMALNSAVLIFLLDGQQVMDDMRTWMRGKAWGHQYLRIAERDDATGRIQRVIAVPVTIMLMGPFVRAITYLVARVPRVPAYALTIGGSIPHSLFWTGLVLGGVWSLVGPYIIDGVTWAWNLGADAVSLAL